MKKKNTVIRILTALLCGCIALSFCACGEEKGNGGKDQNVPSSVTASGTDDGSKQIDAEKESASGDDGNMTVSEKPEGEDIGGIILPEDGKITFGKDNKEDDKKTEKAEEAEETKESEETEKAEEAETDESVSAGVGNDGAADDPEQSTVKEETSDGRGEGEGSDETTAPSEPEEPDETEETEEPDESDESDESDETEKEEETSGGSEGAGGQSWGGIQWNR